MPYSDEIKSADFRLLIEEGAPVDLGKKITSEYSRKWENILPRSLLNFWEFSGIGMFDKGRLHFCDPQLLSGVLPLILLGDKDLHHRNIYIYAYTVFGRIFAWSPSLHTVNIDLMEGTIVVPSLYNKKALNYDPDIAIGLRITAFIDEPYLYDEEDDSGRFMFSRAVKKVGLPSRGESFGFKLALPMGGNRSVDNLEIVKAPEHFSFLAQLQDFVLYDPGMLGEREASVIRPIG